MDVKTYVTVTAEDIKEGNRLDALNCPIARAFQRILKPSVEAEVLQERVFFTLQKPYSLLPKKVHSFINAFDKGRAGKPFSFTLSVPDVYLRPSILKAANKKKGISRGK